MSQGAYGRPRRQKERWQRRHQPCVLRTFVFVAAHGLAQLQDDFGAIVAQPAVPAGSSWMMYGCMYV